MAVEVYVRVDGRPGLFRFLDLINGRYVLLSLDGAVDVVWPYQTRIVAHRLLKT